NRLHASGDVRGELSRDAFRLLLRGTDGVAGDARTRAVDGSRVELRLSVDRGRADAEWPPGRTEARSVDRARRDRAGDHATAARSPRRGEPVPTAGVDGEDRDDARSHIERPHRVGHRSGMAGTSEPL